MDVVLRGIALISLAATAGFVSADEARALCPDGSAPRQAVMKYLRAMHEHRFDDAYEYVTEAMTDGKSKADWSELQKTVYTRGEVEIYGVDIRQPFAVGGDPNCDNHATVPNILSSRDKLNDIGNVEFEVYSVINQEGSWRIDYQESLFNDSAIETWFPQAGSYQVQENE